MKNLEITLKQKKLRFWKHQLKAEKTSKLPLKKW